MRVFFCDDDQWRFNTSWLIALPSTDLVAIWRPRLALPRACAQFVIEVSRLLIGFRNEAEVPKLFIVDSTRKDRNQRTYTGP
jgi:hypothetical protein